MIRAYVLAFCLLSSALFAQIGAANNECLNQFVSERIAVTDVRRLESTVIEADLVNESAYHVEGYGLFYVFELENGLSTEDLPMYMLKFPLAPGEAHTHRMRLSDFDLTADEVDQIAVHVVSSQATTVPGQTVPPILTTCQ